MFAYSCSYTHEPADLIRRGRSGKKRQSSAYLKASFHGAAVVKRDSWVSEWVLIIERYFVTFQAGDPLVRLRPCRAQGHLATRPHWGREAVCTKETKEGRMDDSGKAAVLIWQVSFHNVALVSLKR